MTGWRQYEFHYKTGQDSPSSSCPSGIIEERGIETIFRGQHQLCHALSFIIRTANTFVGSLLWVDFVRLCGMQKAATKAIDSADDPYLDAKTGKMGKK